MYNIARIPKATHSALWNTTNPPSSLSPWLSRVPYPHPLVLSLSVTAILR